MGAFLTSSSSQIADIDHYHEQQTKSFWFHKPQISLIKQVSHFTPSSFPLIPHIDSHTTSRCRQSWEELLNKSYRNSYGIEVAAITVFYNEFYRRLYMFDGNGAFDTILTKYSSRGGGNIAAKGAIIIRIMKYALNVTDTKATKEALLKLGRNHRRMQILPWQYSIFVELLINTIASQLGVLASPEIMVSWVNLFAFMLKYMLPSAIDGLATAAGANVLTHNLEREEVQGQARRDEAEDLIIDVSRRDSRSLIHTLKTKE
jgi:hemoglobin-like flavoprotein